MRTVESRLLCILMVLVLGFFSCEESESWLESNERIYTINELEEAVDLANCQCNEPLTDEGKCVYIKGYIYGVNIFPADSRLLLYAEKHSSNKGLMDLKVNENNRTAFFNSINAKYSGLSDTSWTQVNIKGNIYSWDKAGNGWCKKAIGLNASCISFIN